MFVRHLDHILIVYSSMEHVTSKSPGPMCGWVGRILHPDSCTLVSSWSKVDQEHTDVLELGCRILPTQPHMGPGDFQVTCSILGCSYFVLLAAARASWLVRKTVFAPAKWLAGKVVCEITYNVSSGMLNPTISISHLPFRLTIQIDLLICFVVIIIIFIIHEFVMHTHSVMILNRLCELNLNIFLWIWMLH